MATKPKIDSNVTGLRYAEETTLGVLPATPNWIPLEPNSYDDFGGEIVTVARNPINAGRQRKKGVVTDLNADGGFNTDLTQDNLQDIMQGVMFADKREKNSDGIVDVDGGVLTVDDGALFFTGALIQTTGLDDATNNMVTWVTLITVDDLAVDPEFPVADASPAAGALARIVGVQFTPGEASIDVSGTFPKLVCSTIDATDFGLIPGEWVYVGGDLAANNFAQTADNGFKRVRSVAATYIEFDKSDSDMVTDAGTGKDIRVWFGTVIKNETGTSIVRRSYQLERTLGAPDTAEPSEEQAEYLVGAVPNEATFNIPQADKLTVDISFVAINNEQREADTGVKSGDRPALVEADAFNTSSDFSRLRMALVSDSDEAPEPLFAYLTELNFTINNNVSPNKAVAVLGAFDVTAGTFEVDAEITAYFSTVTAITAVRNNADVTLDAIAVKDNAGIAWDIPLIALGNGRLDVQQDQPITLPLTGAAATGAKVVSTMDHTLLMVFFPYLPTVAAG